MKLEFDFATATLKDAEHAIFLIGAYFGMTNLPTAVQHAGASTVMTASGLPVSVNIAPAPQPQGFDTTPQPDPAAVFGGNVPATAPAGLPVSPTAVASAPVAVAPVAAGDAGNVNGMAAGSAPSLPSAPTAPAPAGIAPAPMPVPAASAPQGLEVDIHGLPWDTRIHSLGEGGTHPKNKDGSWRSKRGLNDAALVRRIEDELRATMATPVPQAPPAPVAPVAPPAPPAPPAAPAVPPAAPTVPPAAPSAPAAPVAPSAPATPADPTTFELLMPRVTNAVLSGSLPKDALLQAVTAYGLQTIPSLAQRPDLVPYVWTYLRQSYPTLA